MSSPLAESRRHHAAVVRPAVDVLQARYPTLPRRLLTILVRAGYTTPAALAAASAAELTAVGRIGPGYLALLCDALGLPPLPSVPRGLGLSDSDLLIMESRPRVSDVPRLVAEVRRLRALLAHPGERAADGGMIPTCW